jgi:hypothetical protein
MASAAQHVATDDRWVNEGVAGDEYLDIVKAGRRWFAIPPLAWRPDQRG